MIRFKSNPMAKVFLLILIPVFLFGFQSCIGGGGIGDLLSSIAPIAVPLAVVLLSGTAAPTVPLVVFAGEEKLKPAFILPFTSEVEAIAVHPDGSFLYSADRLHNTVSVIDLSSRKTISVVDVGTGPRYLSITADGTKLIASNYGTSSPAGSESSISGNKISIVDTTTYAVSRVDLQDSRRPFAITIIPDDTKAYVANLDSVDIAIVDLSTERLMGSISLRTEENSELKPLAMASTYDGSKLLVVMGSEELSSEATGQIWMIDTDTDEILSSSDLGMNPKRIVIHPDDTFAYVTNYGDDTISVIDISNGIPRSTIELPVSSEDGPIGVTINQDGERLYVAIVPADAENPDGGQDLCSNDAPGKLAVIDTQTNQILQTGTEIAKMPLGLVITEDGSKIYAVSACENKVSRVETEGMTALSIEDLEDRATSIAIAPDSSEVYVGHPHAVAVIDTNTDTLAHTGIPIRGAGPTKLVLSADESRVYAMHSGGKQISAVNLSSETVETYELESRPSDLASTNEHIFISNAGFSRHPDNRITVIDQSSQDIETYSGDDTDTDPDTSVGYGPIDIEAVAGAGATGRTLSVTANFGNFYPNSRNPGDSITLYSIGDSEAAIEAHILNDSSFPVDAIVHPDLDADSNPTIYILDFFQSKIHPFRIDPDAQDAQDDPVEIEVTAGDALDLDEDSSGDFIPISGAILSNTLYVASYHSPGTQTTIKIIDIDESDSLALSLNNNQIEIAPDIANEINPVNPGKIVIHSLNGTNYAFILHSGDRSYLCGDPDDAEFCDIGSMVSVVDLSTGNFETRFIKVGERPADIGFSDSKAFVTNYYDSTISIIDLDLLASSAGGSILESETLQVGTGPEGITLTNDGSRAFVANSVDNSISVIEIGETITQNSIRTISL